LAALTAILYFVAYQRVGAFPWASAERAGNLFTSILPKLVFGFLIGGVLADVLPRHIIENWLSDQSGWRGLAVGFLFGASMPIGAPFVIMPMAAGLIKGGAGFGPIVTMLTSAAVFGPARILIYEIPIMGSQFFFVRAAAVFWMPFTAGFIAQQVSARLG
ncbi:MAG: permease, partial [Nitrospinota bacterium]|nr:permease [Nitrospinota bacterium]